MLTMLANVYCQTYIVIVDIVRQILEAQNFAPNKQATPARFAVGLLCVSLDNGCRLFVSLRIQYFLQPFEVKLGFI